MARASAHDRLRRLLAVVPWVVAADGPTLDEVCRRFGMSEDELVAELELLFCCGVHPFTPDALMDVVIEDGRVWIRYADWFDRPLRLTPEEGLALVAAGAALLAVPGADPEGPLARALDKIATVLGLDAEDAVEVVLGTVPEGLLATMREAVAGHRQVEIDYYAYGRDERTRRTVDPYAVFAAEGEWYLAGHCHRAGALRRFRLDRVRSVQVLERTFDPPEHLPAPEVFEARPDDPRVVLELDAADRWVAERYPVEEVEALEGGRLRVTMAVSERAWLERLLLRLGPRAVVVDGADGVASAAARPVLHRYAGSVPT